MILPGNSFNLSLASWEGGGTPNKQSNSLPKKVHPPELTCPLKRNHLKRTFHLPTINFQGICWFQGGTPLKFNIATDRLPSQ